MRVYVCVVKPKIMKSDPPAEFYPDRRLLRVCEIARLVFPQPEQHPNSIYVAISSAR